MQVMLTYELVILQEDFISNGMILYDNAINGNHYIGTSMNGLMAGAVSVVF